MAIIHSAGLGWTEGQDISEESAAIAETFQPGDVFVLDHMYKISGRKIQLPDDFTLAGGTSGAGLDVYDTATNQSPLMQLGHGNWLADLTITHSTAPQTGTTSTNPKKGIDYHGKVTFSAIGADDVSIINSSFSGNVTTFVEVKDAERLTVKETSF